VLARGWVGTRGGGATMQSLGGHGGRSKEFPTATVSAVKGVDGMEVAVKPGRQIEVAGALKGTLVFASENHETKLN